MITQDKERTLNIYRASAGSGKTHLLTGFYIKLLFVNDLLPETHSGEMKFGEVLAVTFTNKATAEMKGRIIEEIHRLSTDPESSDYWDDIAPSYNSGGKASREVTAQRIKEKASGLLVQILNEYSTFNISTIDSFFQKIVRSFARELNIPGNYEVELDSKRVLDAAMSNFLDKLDSKQAPDIFNWMLSFSQKRINEGTGWDFRDGLQSMAEKVLSSEEYHTHSQAIREFTDDKKQLHEYAQKLNEIIENWSKATKELAEKGQKLITAWGITPDDLNYKGAGTVSVFDKIIDEGEAELGARFNEAIENPESMWKKKRDVAQAAKDQMLEVMQCIKEQLSGDAFCNYKTALAIREHFYELGILANIDKELTEYCNEQNVMLLSSTTEMLSRLIEKDDAPFIYEKTGTRIHSYMIDEFQDTSGMQWGNFKPLVSNALAEGYQNLIVGDVKQSIYRWRGGDWNLLDSEINSFESDQQRNDRDSLKTNWRSLPTIVNFNNTFFPDLATKLDELIGSERISRIYGDVEQNLPDKRKKEGAPQGLLKIDFLKPLDADGNVMEKPNKEALVKEAQRRLPEVIIELQRNGYAARDIAILCRKNSECKWAAEALLNYKHEHPDCPYCLDIISNEALLIASRPSVQALINLMRHLLTPDSQILSTIAWSCYYQLMGMSVEESLSRYFEMDKTARSFHPELAHRPLYEMTEELIGLLPEDIRRRDDIFLQAFRDVVLEYTSKQSSDLSGFLNWWETTGIKRSISTPEGQNAIMIMSVHKSKGLGMPAVVMPYASWPMDFGQNNDDIIWCEPKAEPFRQNILLPVSLKKSLEQTIFKEDYTAEREKTVIDNVNTAYVAFTRAKEAMVILAPPPAAKGSDLKDWLGAYCKSQGSEEGLTEGPWLDEEGLAAAHEQWVEKQQKKGAEQATEPARYSRNELPMISILHDPGKPDVTAKERGTYIHLALQHIIRADNAQQVISDLYSRGEIDAEIITEEEMQQTIEHLLSNPQVKRWFSPEVEVFNEMGMMNGHGKQQRADRVIIAPDGTVTVIDYKTGQNHNDYRSQVSRYMATLKDMGFDKVEGYLLFIKDEKVVKVKE